MPKTRLYEHEARGNVEHPKHMIVKLPKPIAVVLKDGAQDDAKTHTAQAGKDGER
jgi:hypothetical protein